MEKEKDGSEMLRWKQRVFEVKQEIRKRQKKVKLNRKPTFQIFRIKESDISKFDHMSIIEFSRESTKRGSKESQEAKS